MPQHSNINSQASLEPVAPQEPPNPHNGRANCPNHRSDVPPGLGSDLAEASSDALNPQHQSALTQPPAPIENPLTPPPAAAAVTNKNEAKGKNKNDALLDDETSFGSSACCAAK